MLRNLIFKLIALQVAVLPNIASAQFAGGSGSAGAPYQISNCTQLQEMQNFKSSHFLLLNDIDCSDTINWNSGAGFVPVGNGFTTTPFTGSFNGAGYVIRNLYINRPSTNVVGLFGYAQGAIQRVGLEDVNITGSDRVGALAGDLSYVTVGDLFATGTVVAASDERVGGLFGTQDNGADALNCYSYVNVSAGGASTTGGILGAAQYTDSVSVINSFAAGPVSGGTQGGVGGSTLDIMYPSPGNTIFLSGVYFDITRAGLSSCVGTGSSTGCTGVNSSNANPNYFFNNSSNAPLNAWDFSAIWKTCPESFPVFINGECNGTLTATNVEPASLLRNATGNVTVSFTTSRSIPATGKMLVTFPSGFTLNSGGVTTASSLTGIDGSLAASLAGQTITLTRSGGTATARNTTVSFVLSNISNPSTLGTTGTYSISIKDGLNVSLDRKDSVSADSITCPSGTYGSSCTNCPGGSGVSACSGNGTCSDGPSGSGTCNCAAGFSSSDCSTCSAGYYGSACSQCPGNGTCSGHGTCSEGIAGTGSCTCSSGYSGPSCSIENIQTPTVKSKIPANKNKAVVLTCSVLSGNVAISSYRFIVRGPIKKKNTKTQTYTKTSNSFSKTFEKGEHYQVTCNYLTSSGVRSSNSSTISFKR